jgi:hypothetical protein
MGTDVLISTNGKSNKLESGVSIMELVQAYFSNLSSRKDKEDDVKTSKPTVDLNELVEKLKLEIDINLGRY